MNIGLDDWRRQSESSVAQSNWLDNHVALLPWDPGGLRFLSVEVRIRSQGATHVRKL